MKNAHVFRFGADTDFITGEWRERETIMAL